jgi:hypothetical protein
MPPKIHPNSGAEGENQKTLEILREKKSRRGGTPRRHSTTSAYSSTSPPPQAGCPSSSHPTISSLGTSRFQADWLGERFDIFDSTLEDDPAPIARYIVQSP